MHEESDPRVGCSELVPTERSTAASNERVRAPFENDETYQNVELWDRELRAAGWLPVSARTGLEVRGSIVWRSPQGLLYRGPYAAWKLMRGRQ